MQVNKPGRLSQAGQGESEQLGFVTVQRRRLLSAPGLKGLGRLIQHAGLLDADERGRGSVGTSHDK